MCVVYNVCVSIKPIDSEPVLQSLRRALLYACFSNLKLLGIGQAASLLGAGRDKTERKKYKRQSRGKWQESWFHAWRIASHLLPSVSGHRSVLLVYLLPPSGATMSLSRRRMTSLITARQRIRTASKLSWMSHMWITDLWVLSLFLSKKNPPIEFN